MITNIHFDKFSDIYDSKKPRYYYRKVKELYSQIIPPNKRILDIGCGTGEMLAHLKPLYGVGIDISGKMIKIAKEKFPHLCFFIGASEDLKINDKFDYVIMVDAVEHFISLESVLNQIHKVCISTTRIVASWYNPIWEPFIKIADFFKLKMPEGPHHIISIKKFNHLLKKTGFISTDNFCKYILPLNIFNLSDIINSRLEKIAFLQRFLFLQVCIFRQK